MTAPVELGTQTERTRLAWSRSVLSLLALVVLEARVLLAGQVVAGLLLVAVSAVIGTAALVGAARRHPRRPPGADLRRDLDGRLPAAVAALGGLVGLGSLVLVLG